MRARGTRVTDIVVLVVAADDGVMPQTIEAIQHAKAANVPIVVAVNKIDKPEADLDRIKNELAKQGLNPEEWGGDTMLIPVSAKTGAGIDDLLDSLLVQAEVLELKAPQEGPGQGIVIESRLDRGKGPVVTILVQRGKLHKGDLLLAGTAYGRVRALLDEQGKLVEAAGPSMPVEVLGLSSAPVAGDEAVVVANERKAREIALFREGKLREAKLAQQRMIKTDDIFGQLDENQVKTLNIILKTDMQGSAEALQEALNKLSTSEVKIKLVYVGVGAITESDANLALASRALILGFNVRADATAKRTVEKEGLIMNYYSVIYELIDQVKNIMNGLLAPEIKENILGLAEVREVFRSAKLGVIAGCMVTEGLVRRNAPIRLLRDNVVIHEGELHSLRRFKDDAAEVRHGMECGIGIKNFTDVRVGDMIEVYERISISRTI
jgi:translation initiation factor IF-2